MQLQTVFDHKVHAVNTYSAATCLENSCYQVLNLLVILVNIDWTFKQACFQMVHFFGTRSMYKLYFFLRSSVNGNQVECFTDNFHSRVYSSEQRWALIFDFRKNEIICTSCPWNFTLGNNWGKCALVSENTEKSTVNFEERISRLHA